MIVRLSGLVPHAPVRFLRSEDRLVVAESHAHLIADYVRVFTREGENVGQEGLDALVHTVSDNCWSVGTRRHQCQAGLACSSPVAGASRGANIGRGSHPVQQLGPEKWAGIHPCGSS
jgi:hypothetical protein